uniref:HAUS augmin-like complex, subunit 4 n=1 Tax=Oryzias sinensis TaxID=183150 RepID=A0A8C7YZN1_9TELE
MSNVTEKTTVNLLGKEANLHQEVLASFPLCDVTEDDLTQNPRFCKLLVLLAQHMDRTGLTASLKAELEKAEQNLQSQRRRWLRTEVLHRGLQEMIQDHQVRTAHVTEPPDQNVFHETMEKCLLVAQCVRQLDPSNATNEEQPSVFGLTPRHVKELMPPDKDVQRMTRALPKQLENHLRQKCLHLLSYYQPECETESEGLKTVKLSHLSALLDKEKARAESLRGTCRENAVLLQRQSQVYLCELMKCIQLLQTLILDHRLKIQTHLDRSKLDYLEGKCELVLQKLKAEMLEVQLDTYTPDSISAHRKIREKLEAELKACRAEKQAAELKLTSFEILGKEFKALADEYCRLRSEIENKKWALAELTHVKN